jgi:hypothetical protein
MENNIKNYTNIKNIKEDFFIEKEKFYKSRNDVFTFYFTYKKFEIGIQYESDESVQYYIISVESYNLPENSVEFLNEMEDIKHIDEYLYALEDGYFDWIKDIYKDLNRIDKKYNDVPNTDAKNFIIKDFFNEYFEE